MKVSSDRVQRLKTSVPLPLLVLRRNRGTSFTSDDCEDDRCRVSTQGVGPHFRPPRIVVTWKGGTLGESIIRYLVAVHVSEPSVRYTRTWGPFFSVDLPNVVKDDKGSGGRGGSGTDSLVSQDRRSVGCYEETRTPVRRTRRRWLFRDDSRPRRQRHNPIPSAPESRYETRSTNSLHDNCAFDRVGRFGEDPRLNPLGFLCDTSSLSVFSPSRLYHPRGCNSCGIGMVVGLVCLSVVL